MPDFLPWYWRWVALGALITASFAAGAALAYKHEERHYAKIIADIRAAGEKQNAAADAAIKAQKNITNNVALAFDSNVRSIDAYYNKRLRDAIASRSKMPAVSNTPGKTNAPAPDITTAPEYITLAHNCALATAQLVDLQNWIKQQEGIK